MFRRRRSIFDLMRELEQEMEREIEHFLMELKHDELAGQCLQPLYDVRETDEEIVVTIDLPGARKEDIDLRVSEDHLSLYAPISYGVRVSRTYMRGATCYRLHLELPEPINVDSASSTYRNGVLEVRMRKKRSWYRIPIE
jgi:HSP20 family protein